MTASLNNHNLAPPIAVIKLVFVHIFGQIWDMFLQHTGELPPPTHKCMEKRENPSVQGRIDLKCNKHSSCNLPVGFPIDSLGKPEVMIANGDHMIAEHCKCK